MTKQYDGIVVIFMSLLSSCATYQVSAPSLSGQLNGDVVSKGFLLATDAVKGNDLKTLKCVDKNGKEKEIAITHRTGIRITKIDKSKTSLYFNTILIKDSSITGSKTHFFNAQIKPIKFSEISKIEIME
ncbi:MAG: hypothetical protein ACXWCG_12135 [Flavitalea sp.]